MFHKKELFKLQHLRCHINFISRPSRLINVFKKTKLQLLYPKFLICNLHLFCFELITRERKGRNFFEENKSLTTPGGRGAIRDPTIFHKIFRYNFEFFPRKKQMLHGWL